MIRGRTARWTGARILVAAALGLVAVAFAGCSGAEFSSSDDSDGGTPESGGTAGAGGNAARGGAASGGASAQSGGNAGDAGAGTSGGSSARGGSGGDGGRGGSGGGDDEDPIVVACRRYTEALCALTARCSDGLYGSADVCAHITSAYCDEWFELPGVSLEPSDLDECAESLEDAGCDAGTLECDLPPGTIENGNPCATSYQCASGYCNGGGSGTCGICGAYPYAREGEACSSKDCSSGLWCSEGTCLAQPGAGEPCSADISCGVAPEPGALLGCVEGRCAQVGQLGEPCADRGGGVLACAQGGFCHAATQLCTAPELAGAGEPCGPIGDVRVDCESGHCAFDGLTAQYHCKTWLAPGDTCSESSSSSECEPGLECRNSACAWPATPSPPVCD